MVISEQNIQPGKTIPNLSSTALPCPLPPSIFKNGTLFNPLAFTKKVAQLYEQIIVNKDSGDSVMQDEAFAMLLTQCTVTLKDGTVVFKMIECETPMSTPDRLIVKIDGLNYHCLDSGLHDHLIPNGLDLSPHNSMALYYAFILFLDKFAYISYIQMFCNYICCLPSNK